MPSSPMRPFRHMSTVRRVVVPAVCALALAAGVASSPASAAPAPTSPVTATAAAKTAPDPTPRVITPDFPAGGPGPAGAPIDTVPKPKSAAATSTPCRSAGPSSDDVALAGAVRPWLTGSLSGLSTDSLSQAVSCARVIVATVQANGMDRQAATIALATAVVESGLRNVTYGDRDSLGLFQQRPSQGWGTPAQVQDPVYATNAFLAAMRRNLPNDAWQRQKAGVVAQRVQVSAFPDRYEPQAVDGVQLVSRLWDDSSQLFTFVQGGALYRRAPANCTTTSCAGGAALLDRNSATTSTLVGYGTYEFQSRTGQLWRSTGSACTSSGCGGWVQLRGDTATTKVVAGLGGVYAFQASTGQLAQYTGSPCVSGTCSGWRVIDRNPATTQVVANETGVYQFQARTGQLWRFTGKPCASACNGWQLVTTKVAGQSVIAGPYYVAAYDAASGRMSLADNIGCSTSNCFAWRPVGTIPGATSVVSNVRGLFALVGSSHVIARWGGQSWLPVDRNPAATGLFAGTDAIYQLHSSGDLWSWTGAFCAGTSCPGWARIASGPGTLTVSGT